MKSITRIIVLTVLLFGCKKLQSSYEINATLPESENGKKAYMLNHKFEPIDSTIIKNGSFKFTGMVEIPKLISLSSGNYRAEMILENTTYTTKLTDFNSYVSGGKMNSLIYGYLNTPEYIKVIKDKEQLDKEYQQIDQTDEEAVKAFNKKADETINNQFKIMNAHKDKILNGDYDNQTKLFVLSRYGIRGEYTFEKIISFINDFEKEYGKTPFSTDYREAITSLKKELDTENSVAIGNSFKNIIAEDVNGNLIDLSKIVKENKYTLLEMWASWCAPCRAQFPDLKKAYTKYHDKGFEIYAISLDTDKEKWIKAMEEENVQWINVVDYKAFKGSAATSYGVSGIPAAFLIDSNGVIVATGNDAKGFSLIEKLETLLEN